MTSWDERFRAGEYPTDPDPSPLLRRYVGTFPDGRALDVATGTVETPCSSPGRGIASTPSTSRGVD